MKVVILIVLMGFFFLISAQEKKGFVNTNQSSSNIEEGSSIRTFDDRYAGVDGHPYLFDDFVVISFTTESNEQINLKGNIDLLNKSILLSQSFNVLSVASMKSFKAEGLSWEILRSGNEVLIIRVIYHGNDFSIVKSFQKILIRAQYSGAYASGSRQDSFREKNRYFVRRPHGLEQINITYTSLSSIFNIPKKEVKKTIYNHYLNIKNEEHYDEILKLFK